MSITTSNSKKRKTSPDNVTPRSSKTKEKNSIGSSGCNTPSSQNSDTSSHESIISIWDESPNMENGLPIPEIDYVDTQTIGLHQLRRTCSIIPQDHVMFSGSIRQNLDPTQSFTDGEIWKALEVAMLAPYIRTLKSESSNSNSIEVFIIKNVLYVLSLNMFIV
jgi:hypothetical protein